jgi:glyoxylase-like metal-dependent hydrolase (beta-lactamase superfamily II)
VGAVEVTGTAQRQAWRDGVLPGVEEVRPQLWSVPVPIPDNPLRYVIVHLLELDDGVAVVDTGWNTEAAWQALVDGLAVAGYTVADVRAALITHIHPDHYGLAGRLREASGAWVALHPADAALLPGRYGEGISAVVAQMRGLLADCGVPAEVIAELSEASMGLREFVSQGEPDVLLEHGRPVELRGWDLVPLHTPGHSPGHVCFLDRDRRLLLSGDHVLPRISPNISIHAQQPGNPLADFLDSLRAIRDLDVEEVLPAHEWRFTPLAARVDELLVHHADRLSQVERAVLDHPGATCWEVTRLLPWSRAWEEIRGFMRRAAVGETLAHLVLLESRGAVRREPGRPWRWRIISHARKNPSPRLDALA